MPPETAEQNNCSCSCCESSRPLWQGELAPGQSLLLVVAGLALWTLVYTQLDRLAAWATYSLLGLTRGTHLAGAIEFFVADAPKVLLLLVLITFIVGIGRTYLTPERIRELLAGRRGFVGYVLAALLGVPTPFCSCSAIPLFLGFVQSGIPLGITMSFLISCPVVNELALAMLYGMYGWKVAALYALLGMTKAVVGGLLIARMKPERYLEPWVADLLQSPSNGDATGEAGVALTAPRMAWSERVESGLIEVREILAGTWHYLVGGIALGALIYGYIPVDYVSRFMGEGAWWNVPIAVLLGLPLYASAAGVMPIVQAVLAKGAALGTALAFMMSVIGISIPELVMLRKVIRLPLMAVFVTIVGLGCIVVGYLFNALL